MSVWLELSGRSATEMGSKKCPVDRSTEKISSAARTNTSNTAHSEGEGKGGKAILKLNFAEQRERRRRKRTGVQSLDCGVRLSNETILEGGE